MKDPTERAGVEVVPFAITILMIKRRRTLPTDPLSPCPEIAAPPSPLVFLGKKSEGETMLMNGIYADGTESRMMVINNDGAVDDDE